ncbi:TPA: hypothetical protein DDW35_03820, partial [Candidatus Sumerlaeota bacterium]|nr:hypothetical protein [Candidatus Sumerlaeota bacterium]
LKLLGKLYSSNELLTDAAMLLEAATGVWPVDGFRAAFQPDGNGQWGTAVRINAPVNANHLTVCKSPSIALSDLSIGLEHTIYNQNQPDDSHLICVFDGKIEISGHALGISMIIYDPYRVWTLEVRPDVTLPTLGEIVTFFAPASDGLDTEINNFLAQLGPADKDAGITVERLQIGFDPSGPTLRNVKLTLTQKESWPIVSDFLEVKINEVSFTVQFDAESSKPELEAFLDGSLFLGAESDQVELGVSASVPSMNIAGSLRKAAKFSSLLNVLQVDGHGLPKEFVDAEISEMEIYACGNPSDINFGAHARCKDLLKLDLFNSGAQFELNKLGAGIGCDLAGKSMEVQVWLEGEISLILNASKPMVFDLRCDIAKQARLKASAHDVSLTEIVRFLLDTELPEGVPEVTIKDLALEVGYGSEEKGFHISGEITVTGSEKLTVGSQEIVFADLIFDYNNKSKTGKENADISCSITLKGKNLPEIPGIDAHLKDYSFEFKYDVSNGRKEWMLGGSVAAEIFSTELMLAASYKDLTLKDSTKQCFALSLEEKTTSDTGKNLSLGIPDVASLTFRSFELGIERTKTANKSATVWHVSTNGALVIYNPVEAGTKLLSVDGKSFLENEGTETKFIFTPEGKDGGMAVSIPLPVLKYSSSAGDTKTPAVTWAMKKIEILCGEKSGSNSFSASSELSITNLPEQLADIFNEKICLSSALKINDKGLHFEVTNSDTLVKFDYPTLRIDNNTSLALGKGAIGVSKFTLDVTSDNLSVNGKISIGLPSELNNVLAKTLQQDTGEFKLFRTYSPDSSTEKKSSSSTVDFTLGFDLEKGLSLNFSSSPFITPTIEEKRVISDGKCKKNSSGEYEHEKKTSKDNHSYIYFDLEAIGGTGVLEFQVPEFVLDAAKGSFKAAGGFEIVGDVQIPLTTLKTLLKALNIESASNVIPDSIPIKGITFYTEKDGFRFENFFSLFGVQDNNMQQLKGQLQAIDNVLNRLPGDLLEYGNIEIPKHLNFELEVTADGSCSGKFSVKADKDSNAIVSTSGTKSDERTDIPVKLIIPTFPQLIGIKLYSLSFGELFGGSALRLDIDADIDVFDLVTLVASLVLPEVTGDNVTLFPDPHTYRKRCTLQNLFMFIIYETGFPIIIPVFYDKIGFSYRGLEGLELESSFKFPKPTLSLEGVGAFLTECSNLIQGKDLNLENLEKAELTTFTVGANYIRLPKYISIEEELGTTDQPTGKLIGTEEGFSIKPLTLLGGMFNAAKNNSFNDLVQVVELKHRIGVVDLTLCRVIKAHCEYAFTTPAEFLEASSSLTHLKEDKTKTQWFLDLAQSKNSTAVSTVKKNPEGLVVAFDGEFSVANVLEFYSGFGLVVIADGLVMGMQMDGHLSDLFSVHLDGFFGCNNENGKFLLKGDDCSLTLLGQNILSGSFRFSEEEFYIQGQAGNGQIVLAGELSGSLSNDLFHLTGSTELRFFGLSAYGKSEFLVSAQKKLIHLEGALELGDFMGIQIALESFADEKEAQLQLAMSGHVSKLLEVSVAGYLSMGKQLELKGSGYLKIAGTNIIAVQVFAENGIFAFQGQLNLLPDNDYLTLSGSLKGFLSASQFALDGSCTLKVFSISFASTTASITHERFILYSKLFNLQACLLVAQDYMSGTLAPVSLGTLLQIKRHGAARTDLPCDLGGPYFQISTNSKKPLYRLNGEVSVLGLSAICSDIDFDQAGAFRMELGAQKIFNAFQVSLIITGNDFKSSDGITVSGEILGLGDEFFKQTKDLIRSTAEKNKKTIDAVTKPLEDVLNACTTELKECRKTLKSYDEDIKILENKIADLHKEYNAKSSWDKFWGYASYAAKVTLKNIDLGLKRAARLIADAALLVAQKAVELAQDAVEKGKQTIKNISESLANLSIKVLEASENFFVLEQASFQAGLNAISGGYVTASFKGKLLDKEFNFTLQSFSLSDMSTGVKLLAQEVINRGG